jgi:hypothetical protein
MKRIFTLYIIVLVCTFAADAQNTAKVLQDIENYKLVTLPNGFRVQIVTTGEYQFSRCRITADVSGIDEGTTPGIKSVVAAMTGSQITANEIIARDFVNHDLALDSLLHFLYDRIYTEKHDNPVFDDFKQNRLNYLAKESTKPYKKTSAFADLQSGLNPLPADYLNAIYKSDYVNYKNFCFSPERCLLTIVSDMKPEDIEPLVQKYFSPLTKQTTPLKIAAPDIKPKDIIYFIEDSMLSDVALSQRHYFACQKTPKNYVLNNIVFQVLYGNYSNSAKDQSAFSYDVYSLDCSQQENALKDFATNLMKPFNGSFNADSALQKVKTKITSRFNEDIKHDDFAAEIASYLVLYKFPNSFFTGFEKSVNAVTASEVQNFIKTVNKNGCNVFAFTGNHENIHCAVLALTGERELDITDFNGNVSFVFEKGFSVKTIFDKYLQSTAQNTPPKSFAAQYSSVYKYVKTGAQYAASGRILRKIPNMYLLENFVIHTDSSKVFHYKEVFDGVSAYDTTKLYGMEEVDSVRFNVLKKKAYYPFEAQYEKTSKKCRLECDYKTFKSGCFKVGITDLNLRKTYAYYNIESGLLERTEILGSHGHPEKRIFYEYSSFDKYVLPSVIREVSAEMETEINFSLYDFTVSPKKQDFFVGERDKKKKTGTQKSAARD